VEIQKNAEIGRLCKISSHAFICDGVRLGDEVFVGHGVMFTNVLFPRATTAGRLQTEDDWECIPTRIENGASLGSGSIILCGITIGEKALVGAGAVVTRSVPPYKIVAGSPAKVIGDVRDHKEQEAKA
jgi:acetyltransferase-like isoleucine patch superfamily enzyme